MTCRRATGVVGVGGAILCEDVRLWPDRRTVCPERDRHTPAPARQDAWCDWADAMTAAGARQERCPGCGLWSVWTEPIKEVEWP